MPNSNLASCQKAAVSLVTSLLAALLLSSAGLAQDLRSTAQQQEGLYEAPKAANAVLVTSSEAVAAPSLTITPLTWGTAGLDSNSVGSGPNVFPVGARVCNTGNATATNLASAFVWDSANALVNLRAGSNSSLSVATVAAGACVDLYYEIEITRSSAAYDTTRRFHITATADTLAAISTPIPREIYVEHLVSQNRNSVTGIKLNGINIPFGGTMNMTVGNTYSIEVDASTATNGYEQLESFINLPNVIFQTLSVTSGYSAPTGYTGDKLYADSCGWDSAPTDGTYRSCTGPANISGGKAGGTVVVTYIVKVLSGGGTSQTLNTLVYDFSGSSYHYNSDLSSSAVIAKINLQSTAAALSVEGRVMLPAGNGIRNVNLVLTESNGRVHFARSSSFGYYRFDNIPGGQSAIVTISSKRYTFTSRSRLVALVDDLTDLDFIADQ